MSRIEGSIPVIIKDERKIKDTSSWALIRSLSSVWKRNKQNSISSSQLSIPNCDSSRSRASTDSREYKAAQNSNENPLAEVAQEVGNIQSSVPGLQAEVNVKKQRREWEKLVRAANENDKKGVLSELHIPVDDIPTENTFPVDIIAIHGINGNSKTTWTHDNGAFWIRDFLPDEFPGARIYTYGYNANIFHSRGTGDITTFATDLLEQIVDTRAKLEDQKRPIIFICHSMGGLVIKQALVEARLNPERYSNMMTSTSAIFFMATPHRGSDDAGFAGVVTDILNITLIASGMSRFKGRSRSDLIKALKKDCKVLKDITRQFVPLTDGKIKFFCFLEELKLKGIDKLIVNDVSGKLNVAAEIPPIHMDADHRSIVRFDSKKCPNYRKVLAKMHEAVKHATNPCYKAIVEEDIPCLQSLAFKSMIDRKLEADRAHPTTCAWILKHSHFITWQKSTRGLLWIKGHPGTGKSTMMAFIHRRLTSEHTKTARIDFFFTRRGEELQRSPLGMFRSLLHQLYRQSLIARELIYQAFDEKRRNFGGHGTEWDWQTHELKQLLTSVVKKVARKREITIFVDALDEAVDESDNKVAEQLVEYFHTLNDLPVDEGFVGGIKICISCRHYPVVGSLGPGASIVMEDENRRDLWQFVHDRLSSEVAHWYSEPPDVGQRLVNTIVDKAAGVFLWAALRVPKIVKSLNDGSVSIQKISMVVEGESKELFALYETIFANDVPETQRANALLFLQWVCFAQRPLTLAELRFAIASDEDEAWSGACFEDSADFVESDTRMARLTKSLSGGLAEVKSSEKITTVQFVHETVNDFLRSRGLKFIAILSITERKMYSHNVVGRSESRLSNSCLNYIMKRQIEEMTGEWLDGGDTQPIFLDYATRHWAGHARKAEERGVQQTHIISLFDSSPELLELWIKVYKRLDKQSFQRPLRDSTLLHIAAASNLYSVVHALLKSGASVQKRDEFGNTALHLAVFYGYENITTLLLDYNAGIEVKTKSYSTPLELAAANGHEGLVKLLLKRGADVNQETEYEGSALQAACAKGNFSLVKILLGNGADLNARGGTNFTTHGSVTALQAAVYAENGKLVKFLLQKGADVHIQGGYYGNALQIAAYRGHTDIIDMLLEVGADINAQGGYWGNALQAAGAYYGRLDLIKYFLQRGAFINAEGGRFGTVLQAVASHPDHEKIIQYLIDEGADVNAQGGEFGNPLLAAISAGTEESLRILLNNGARMDVQGGQHGNVLQAAVWSSNKELVKMFLDQGIDVNIRGGEFGTALQAAMMRSQAIAELLLDYGADVNATGGTHHNALNAAIFFNRADHVRLLLNRGAEVNSIKGGHACALQRAAKRGRLEIVQTLLCHGADINLMSGLCSSPLQAAASEGHQAIVELLLDSGADIDLHTSTFGSALQTAALHGHKKIVELLLERGADADLESGVYGNALQVAKGNKSITRLLLAHGAKTRDSIEVSDLLKDLNN